MCWPGFCGALLPVDQVTNASGPGAVADADQRAWLAPDDGDARSATVLPPLPSRPCSMCWPGLAVAVVWPWLTRGPVRQAQVQRPAHFSVPSLRVVMVLLDPLPS